MVTRATSTDWAVFVGSILVMMIVDYLVFSKRSHRVSFREATIRSVAWIGLALAFNVYVFVRHGADLAVPYLVAFLVEKSLSVDNLFVFLAVFSYFHVKGRAPAAHPILGRLWRRGHAGRLHPRGGSAAEQLQVDDLRLRGISDHHRCEAPEVR